MTEHVTTGNDPVRPLDLTVGYLERYASWCVVLACPPGCDCGERQILHGFPSREAAQEFASKEQAGWPSSPEADLLRADIAAREGQ